MKVQAQASRQEGGKKERRRDEEKEGEETKLHPPKAFEIHNQRPPLLRPRRPHPPPDAGVPLPLPRGSDVLGAEAFVTKDEVFGEGVEAGGG